MDEIQEFNINSSTSGIKLFGATISVNKTSSSSASSQTNVNDDPGQSQTMVEHKKRPADKIIPCPRCKSMETKFCYFNNYDVNQPRHFCKGCRRYWTSGGALRNVPAVSSRRKAKPPCKSVVVVEERVFLENSGMEEVLDVAGKVVAEGWHVVNDGGVRRHLFPAKRRRCGLE